MCILINSLFMHFVDSLFYVTTIIVGFSCLVLVCDIVLISPSCFVSCVSSSWYLGFVSVVMVFPGHTHLFYLI